MTSEKPLPLSFPGPVLFQIFLFLFLLSLLGQLLLNGNVPHVLALGSLFFSFHTFSLGNSSIPKISITAFIQGILKQSPD